MEAQGENKKEEEIDMVNCRLKRNRGSFRCKSRSKAGKWAIDLVIHIVIIWVLSLLLMSLFQMGLVWTFIGVFIIAVALLLSEMGVEKAME